MVTTSVHVNPEYTQCAGEKLEETVNITRHHEYCNTAEKVGRNS